MLGSNNSVSVQRLLLASNKETYTTAHITALEVYLERMQPELAQFYDGSGGYEVFKMYTDAVADIRETDKVTDAQNVVYLVKGVQHYGNNTDVTNHSEIVMMKAYDKV